MAPLIYLVIHLILFNKYSIVWAKSAFTPYEGEKLVSEEECRRWGTKLLDTCIVTLEGSFHTYEEANNACSSNRARLLELPREEYVTELKTNPVAYLPQSVTWLSLKRSNASFDSYAWYHGDAREKLAWKPDIKADNALNSSACIVFLATNNTVAWPESDCNRRSPYVCQYLIQDAGISHWFTLTGRTTSQLDIGTFQLQEISSAKTVVNPGKTTNDGDATQKPNRSFKRLRYLTCEPCVMKLRLSVRVYSC